MSVTLTGYILVPMDRLEAIRSALPLHIDLTRAEAGCLSFEVVENLSEPGRFDVAEEFVDSDAFRAHQARVQVSDWGRISGGIPRHYTVEGLDA